MSRLTLPSTIPVSIVVVVCLLAFGRNEPERFADVRQHFKYGSIGAEGRAGVPYWIWLVRPRLFPDLLPARPGQGYERFGLIFESPQARRPIGTSYRETQTGLVGWRRRDGRGFRRQ